MSDIYLQITETPTVVTLSAPVISGALSSTVTVANTVTVALDSNSLSALENVTVTVGAAVTISNFPSSQAVTFSNLALTDTQLRASAVTVSGAVTASISNFPASTVVCAYGLGSDGTWRGLEMVPGSNRLKVEAINSSGGSSFPISGSVTIGAGTAQIGSVTASISGTVPVSGTFWQATQPVSGTFFQATQPVSLTSTTVTVSSLPALAAGTAQIGSVTASISGTVPISISSVTIGNSVTIGSCVTHGVTITNTVVTFFPAQGTTVSATNFTSTTASTTLVSAVDGREVLTVFNEGAGNLHISPGATCTTVAYQVRLSAGDYWECPAGQLSLLHSAVFATAGTARVCQVS